MTAEDVFEKMRRLKITRDDLARRAGAFPQTLTNFRDGTFTMTKEDAERLSQICDEIAEERLVTFSPKASGKRRKEVAA